MSGAEPPAPPVPEDEERPPEARVRRRGRFSLVWLIPIVAIAIAIYLGFTTLAQRGPRITISFPTANGLTAGQTQVKHKYVALGTVEGVSLSKDMSHVDATVQMRASSTPFLTDHARFWVVRPRLSPRDLSGLDTLVSGAFIAIDPGKPGGKPARKFAGLSNPPGFTSETPGHRFVVEANSVGSLGPGSPVFFRDVQVGEVLGYKLRGEQGPTPVDIFVRAPYDKYVRRGSRFWNSSGLSLSLGAGGVHVELQSLQAVLSGGISFKTPGQELGTDVAPNDTHFPLFESEAKADAAPFPDTFSVAAVFQQSVQGLAPGSPVTLYGIQVGSVTDIKLGLDPAQGSAQVRVTMQVQPQLAFTEDEVKRLGPPLQVMRALVKSGLRAQLDTTNYLTGGEAVAFGFVPGADPASVTQQGDVFLLPSAPGGLASITSAVGDIANKLRNLPLDRIANHLDTLLASANQTIAGPDLKHAIHSLSATLLSVQDLTRQTDRSLQPTLRQLPATMNRLQQTLAHADTLLAGYGRSSDFSRNLEQVMGQADSTLRSIRLFVDFLSRHPNALILGKSNK